MEVEQDKNLAILRIATFDKKKLRNDYKQNFRKEIRSALKIIDHLKIGNFVIDLRDNQGGDLSNGAFLLSQITDRKIEFISSLQTLKKQSRELKGKTLFNHQVKPKKNNYQGKVFLLINGGSFSCSAMVANTFKRAKLGLIIGEMSGGSAYTNTGDPHEMITLTYSKIKFTVPTLRFNLGAIDSKTDQGVSPDIEIIENYDKFIGRPDLCLKEVYKHL